MFFSELIDRAAEFAAVSHRCQLRKGSSNQVPYIHHCYMVGLILDRAGFPDTVVAAGILHDVIEDTEVTEGELRAFFGAKVSGLVNAVSEQDKNLAWEERKARFLEGLQNVSPDAMAIATADKIHNISSLIRSLEDGSDVWHRFRQGRAEQLQRFRQFRVALGRQWEHPLMDELAERLSVLESMG